MVCVSRTFVLSGNEGLGSLPVCKEEDPNPLTDRHLLKFSSPGAAPRLMLTWLMVLGPSGATEQINEGLLPEARQAW